jgi:DNA modification methylase
MIWKNRITKYTEEAPDQLLANPRNWRSHPGAQADALRGILGDVGVVQNVLANERTGFLLDGHLRVMEALKAGQPTIPVTWVDLSEDEEALILATLDPLAAMAGTDAAQLDALLRDVSTDSPAVQAMLDALATEAGIVPPVGAGGDEFDATPEDGPTRTQAGDLWRIGPHRLLVGDCTDAANVARLMGGERVDCVFTSPPYNLGDHVAISNRAKALKSSGSAYVGASDNMTPDQYCNFLGAITDVSLAHADYLLLNVQSLAGNKIALIEWLYQYRDRFADVAIWHKTNQQPAMAENVMNSSFEFVYFLSAEQRPSRAIRTGQFRGTFSNVYTSTINVNAFSDVHGAAFPLDFAQTFIEAFTQSAVLDLFLGTGTTLIAAHRTGRRCYGMEIEPRYADVILRRAEAEGLTVAKVE